jgi:hypothetical protein
VDYCDKKVTLMLLCALQMGAINDPLCRQDGENVRHFHSFRCRSQPEAPRNYPTSRSSAWMEEAPEK